MRGAKRQRVWVIVKDAVYGYQVVASLLPARSPLTQPSPRTRFARRASQGEEIPFGEVLEQGWEKRGSSSALRRNSEVWKFALKSVFKVLKPRKLKKKGASEKDQVRMALVVVIESRMCTDLKRTNF
jgi:hypothetical protein